MAYSYLLTNLEGNCDFTTDKFTVCTALAAEMQEHHTNTRISIICLQVFKILRKVKALVT